MRAAIADKATATKKKATDKIPAKREISDVTASTPVACLRHSHGHGHTISPGQNNAHDRCQTDRGTPITPGIEHHLPHHTGRGRGQVVIPGQHRVPADTR